MPAIKNQTLSASNLAQHQPQPLPETRPLCDQALEALAQGQPLEEILNQDNNLLRTFMDNTPGMVYVKDTHSRFLLASQSMLQMLGLTGMAELIGKTSSDFFVSDLAQQSYQNEQIVLRTGRPLLNREEFVVSLADPDNKGWYSTSTIPMVITGAKLSA